MSYLNKLLVLCFFHIYSSLCVFLCRAVSVTGPLNVDSKHYSTRSVLNF